MEYVKGHVLAKTCRLDMLIEKGGMGLVCKGTHVRLGREVAVKLLLREYVQYKDKITRFLNEAISIASLRNRNIVNMEDTGLTDDGVPFFVMEHLKGESLRDRLSRETKPFVGVSARILIQTLSGMAALDNRQEAPAAKEKEHEPGAGGSKLKAKKTKASGKEGVKEGERKKIRKILTDYPGT